MSAYIYLAAPYTAPEPSLQRERFRYTIRALRILMERGEVVFCPITYGHFLEDRLRRTFPHEYWLRFCRAILAGASHLYVLTARGWEESRGVREEVHLAHSLGIPIIGFSIEEPGFEDVSGFDILGAFDLAPHKQLIPINFPKDTHDE